MNILYISPVTYFQTDDTKVYLYINGILVQTWPSVPIQDDNNINIDDDSNDLITG